MPDDQFERLLVAPETYCVLVTKERRDRRALAAFLESAILAEEFRSAIEAPISTGIWTALGDCYIGYSPPDAWAEVLAREHENIFYAPLVDDTIPIDLACPERPFVPGQDFHHLVYLSIQELICTIQKLNSAIHAIKIIAPTAYLVVRAFTRSFILRKHLLRERAISSASSNAAIGRSLLVNPHCKEVDEADLSDACVHEAIHSLLSTFECDSPFLREADKVSDIEVESPWTGKSLRPLAFLHASLVWYGLLQFWIRASVSNAFDSHRCEERCRFIADGFSKGSLRARLQPFAAFVNPEILDLVDALQDTVVAGAKA